MGSCFSKKGSSPPAVADYVAISSAPAPAALAVADSKVKPSVSSMPAKQEQIGEKSKVKKEIFIIKHRKSHDDRDRQQRADGVAASAPIATAPTTDSCNQVSMDDKKAAEASTGTGVRVRTSSCNKEEVDAILIQCGRLSRSSSGKAASSSSTSCDRGKKYSGSKRSYDFDNCEIDYQVAATSEDAKNNDDLSDEKTRHHRQRHRQSPRHSPSQGRRRTPSRERSQQQRSSSRERRTSRSPGRRLSMEQNNPNCNANTTATATANVNSDTNGTSRAGKMKMVSVPATVNRNGESATTGSIKRISVKRNAGDAVNVAVGSRNAASPHSQSPARGGANAKASNDSLQPSLSRSSSRKAEQSPYRRNPLSELDPNALAYPQAHINNTNNKSSCNVLNQLKPNVEITGNKIITQGINYRSSTASSAMDNKVVEPAGASGVDCLKHQTLTRSRSFRRSRDLDIDPQTLSNPPPSYTRLLLEDIQNFHQQSSNAAVVSLPQCVTKACSILEAVADLNSTTNFSADRKSPSIDQINKSSCYYNCSLDANPVPRKDIPFVESEVFVGDDLVAPSFHKYVTLRRAGTDMEDQESSGSNSFVSGSQQWGLSSSWEPNSADSTDCWTSRSSTREDQIFDMDEAARRRLSRRKTDGQNTQSSCGIGRGKLAAASKGLPMMPVVAAAAST